MIFQKIKNKLLFSITVIGNVLDHYDSALYVFLAPFLAPLFFPSADPVVGLILVYGIKSVGIVTRPLGAIIFGYIASRYRVKNVLALTLFGVSVCTFCIGIIPSYSTVGILAPVLLCILKAIQGVFASGEHSIASLFFIDQTREPKKHGRASSYYLCSTMGGTLLASYAAMLVSQSSNPEFYWRLAFLAGVFTGIIGLIIRLLTFEEKLLENRTLKLEVKPRLLNLSNSIKLLKITIMSSFSFLTYTLPFIFLNNFIPLLGNLKIADLLTHNTILLGVDIALIPLFGILADKFNFAKIMTVASFLLAITIVPIFYVLPELTIWQITLIKLWIIIIGVAFVAPLNALLFRMLQGKEKYLVAGLGYSLGTELLGRNIPMICLLIWEQTHSTLLPATYLCAICIATFLVLANLDRDNINEKNLSNNIIRKP